MNYEIIIALIAFLSVVFTVVVVPYLKKKGVWTIALLAVNIAEQIAEFLLIKGAGVEKYEFVKRILLMLSPNLTETQIHDIIETLVDRMNKLKGV